MRNLYFNKFLFLGLTPLLISGSFFLKNSLNTEPLRNIASHNSYLTINMAKKILSNSLSADVNSFQPEIVTDQDFGNWIIEDIDKKLPGNQYYILIQKDKEIWARSVDNSFEMKISTREITAARQLSYDGKILELASEDEQIFLDLENKTTFPHPDYESNECFTRPTSPDMKWKIDICGNDNNVVKFIEIAKKKKEYSIDLPGKNYEFLNWSFDGNYLSLVQADLDNPDQNEQPGTIVFIEISCLNSKETCIPKVLRSFSPKNFPLWNGVASSWSPDNTYLAFTNINYPVDLLVLNMNDLKLISIQNTTDLPIRDISWSPDGKNLLIQQGTRLSIIDNEMWQKKQIMEIENSYLIGWLSTNKDSTNKVRSILIPPGA